ncbi:MAG: glycosyltransferase family 2 protein [Patescibacteria group bacterium]
MDLTISIVNYNTKDLVKQCVKNIINSNISLDYEIIIADNNSSDGSSELFSKEILPHSKRVKLIKFRDNRGFGAGHNLSLQKSNAKYALIINPDIVTLNNAISSLYKFMEKEPKCGIAGPKLIYPDLTVQPSCHTWPKFITPLYRRTPLSRTAWGLKKTKHYDMIDYDHKELKKVDWLVGACLMIRKTVWDKIQGFDERYFLYCEDIDICRKCWNAKFEVWYIPEAKMIHYHKRLSAQKKWWQFMFNKSSRTHIQSHLKYFKKWGFK